MTAGSSDPGATVLDRLIEALAHATRYAPGAEDPPAVLLWPDRDEQWRGLLPRLRSRLPQLLTLGPFDLEARTGPAIWAKCVLAGTLPEPKMPAGEVPILYLPGVERQTLRAGEECPRALQPLVELLYRGAVFSQRNGRDWSVEAFLMASDGLGLELARDARTREALLGALDALAATRVAELSGHRLEAEHFDRLLVEDPERDLLAWLSEPEARKGAWDVAHWAAFRARCREEYGFDPESEGVLAGGERLGAKRSDRWKKAWRRFTEAPSWFPGIPSLLEQAKPVGEIVFDREPWPDENRRAEGDLRSALLHLGPLTAFDARARLRALEAEHGTRREWVWARLGQSPLARALEGLARIAERTASELGGDDPEAMAAIYRDHGFLADAAALAALAEVDRAEDVQAVATALRAAYLPWLDEGALRFQALVASQPLPSKGNASTVAVKEGDCLVFVDGLRFDLAERLRARLEAGGAEVDLGFRWSALPTVTANSKPAVSPLAAELDGVGPVERFAPRLAGQTMTTARLRSALVARGFQVLDDKETGEASRPGAKGWAELGEFDSLGHEVSPDRFAKLLASELERLAECIGRLLEAGWKRVRVVTDHGWLLLPGGLPKAELASGLAIERGARCVRLGGEPTAALPRFSWYWQPAEFFGTPRGAAAFVAGTQYAHGGVSVQECVLPELMARRKAGVPSQPLRVAEVTWAGLRCRVRAENAPAGTRVDLRRQPIQPGSRVVQEGKTLDSEGRASLVVPDDTLAGQAVFVVLLDPEGRLLAKIATAIGGDS
jgi:hypothetical protein